MATNPADAAAGAARPPASPEGYFYVGSSGPTKGGHTGGGYGAGFGFQPGTPGFNATAGAYQQTEAARQDALKKLQMGFALGPVGQAAQNRYMNPQGFDPRALEMQRRMAAELEAGSRGNALMRLRQTMTAKGFGDSASLADAESRLRTGSAANLNNEYSRLFIANEQAKQQEMAHAAQVLMQLYGMDLQTALVYAQMQANYTAPVIPGITPGPGGQNPMDTGHGTPPAPGAYWDPLVGGSGGWASR